MRTHFHDFTRDDSSPVMIEYSFRHGSPSTYSPHSGAVGGDPDEVGIVSVVPNTPEYEALCKEALALEHGPISFWIDSDRDDRIAELRTEIEAARNLPELTGAEVERFDREVSAIDHNQDGNDDIQF